MEKKKNRDKKLESSEKNTRRRGSIAEKKSFFKKIEPGEITKREMLINILVIAALMLVVARLFYGTFLAVFVVIPIGVLMFYARWQKLESKKMEELEIQFKDMLVSMSDAVSAGYSVENAIKESYKDLLPVYGKDSYICLKVAAMISRMEYNESVEQVLWDFANTTELENAKTFIEVFAVAKKSGGNLKEVIKSVTDNIVLKESVKREINASISEKKMEQMVMTFIPLFLIVYVGVASPGFLDVMYETIMGKIIMTVCLICYAAAYFWAEKMTELKV